MSSRIQLFSTLTADQKYTFWKTFTSGAAPEPVREIIIKGGANVATRLLVTPKGARTEISEDDLALLQENEVFKRHVEGGFITWRKEIVEPEVAVADGMAQRDKSAPPTPETIGDDLRGTTAKLSENSVKDTPVKRA